LQRVLGGSRDDSSPVRGTLLGALAALGDLKGSLPPTSRTPWPYRVMMSPVRIRVPPLVKFLLSREILEGSGSVAGAHLLQPCCDRDLAGRFLCRSRRCVTHDGQAESEKIQGRQGAKMERSIEKQAQEMTCAAREMTQAARELRRAVDRLTELHQRPNRASALTELLGSGGLSEEEAERLVREAVHEVRAEIFRERELSETDEEKLPPPTPGERKEWERRREERRQREGYYQPR
jgi:hypothetical protein